MSELTAETVSDALATAPEATGRTHDYTTRGWGHDYILTRNDGLNISGHLFRNPLVGVREGDWLILPNGESSTRYRITEARWLRDPDDMWTFKAVFDPRSES